METVVTPLVTLDDMTLITPLFTNQSQVIYIILWSLTTRIHIRTQTKSESDNMIFHAFITKNMTPCY